MTVESNDIALDTDGSSLDTDGSSRLRRHPHAYHPVVGCLCRNRLIAFAQHAHGDVLLLLLLLLLLLISRKLIPSIIYRQSVVQWYKLIPGIIYRQSVVHKTTCNNSGPARRKNKHSKT